MDGILPNKLKRHKGFHPDKSRIILEVLSFGFEPFDGFPYAADHSIPVKMDLSLCKDLKPDETLGDILENVYEEPTKKKNKPKVFTAWNVDMDNPCIRWLETQSKFEVQVPHAPFSLTQFTSYNKQILPTIYKEKAVAVLGLRVTTEAPAEPVQARVLLRAHPEVCHQSDLDLQSLFNVLHRSFGVSHEDFYKSLRFAEGRISLLQGEAFESRGERKDINDGPS